MAIEGNRRELRKGLVVCGDTQAWDEFCAQSAEGTPFMMSWFVAAVGDSAIRYFWYENGVPAAAILVPLADGMPISPMFSVHHSLCYAGAVDLPSKPEHTRRRFRVLTSIVESLAASHERLKLSLHPRVTDVRPLQWHNYHQPERGTFRIAVRYTAVRSLPVVVDTETVLSGIRKDRIADYRRALKEVVKITSEVDVEEFLALYAMTFERQNIDVDRQTLATVERVLRGMSPRDGFVLLARNRGGLLVSATVVLVQGRCAYGLFTANHPEHRKLGANTVLVVAAMEQARSRGAAEYDFVGANSPNRADYKTSFNADLRSYFEAELQGLP